MSNFTEGARYFDQGIFSNGNGLDTPLSHPLVDNNTVSDFGFKFLSAQNISEPVFNISDTDDGNKDRVPHLFMTFGQFMDHDFAYVIHDALHDLVPFVQFKKREKLITFLKLYKWYQIAQRTTYILHLHRLDAGAGI